MGGKESCVDAARNLGTWPVIAGVRRKERREPLFSKISLKYWGVE